MAKRRKKRGSKRALPANARSVALSGMKFHCYKKLVANARGRGKSARGYCRRDK